MTERRRRQYSRNKMTQAQELEMIERYRNGESVTALAAEYGVQATYPYRVLQKHNVTWRKQRGRRDDIPAPALTATLEVEPEVLDFGDEDPAAADREHLTLEPRDLQSHIQLWTVEITEHLTVSGHTIDEAIGQARRLRPDAWISGVRAR